MQELADFCHGAVALGMRDGLNMVLLERTRARHGQSLMLDIGSDVDMATSAIGWRSELVLSVTAVSPKAVGGVFVERRAANDPKRTFRR